MDTDNSVVKAGGADKGSWGEGWGGGSEGGQRGGKWGTFLIMSTITNFEKISIELNDI